MKGQPSAYSDVCGPAAPSRHQRPTVDEMTLKVLLRSALDEVVRVQRENEVLMEEVAMLRVRILFKP